jgi:hypothetical protein
MGGAVKREWIEAAQRERDENREHGAKAVARWDDEGGAPVTAKRPRKHDSKRRGCRSRRLVGARL